MTTKELQAILCVDRRTIYRLLKEGRLPAVRVGRQWRFHRAAIETWLVDSSARRQVKTTEATPLSIQVLPLECLGFFQEVLAESQNICAVTTNLRGEMLTPFSGPGSLCQLILATTEGQRRCQDSRARLSQADYATHLEKCHAGLAFARGCIEVNGQFVAMLFAEGFLTTTTDRKDFEAKSASLAVECNIPIAELRAAAKQVHVFGVKYVEKILDLLEKAATQLPQTGQQRLDLVQRLHRIGQLVVK